MKLIAALALLISVFLPMSSCTTQEARYADPNGIEVIQKAKTTYQYVWSRDQATKPGAYIMLLAFLWPVIGIAVEQRLSRRWRMVFAGLELLLLTGTGYFVCALTWWGHTESGGYIAIGGASLYAIAWLLEFGGKTARWFRVRFIPVPT